MEVVCRKMYCQRPKRPVNDGSNYKSVVVIKSDYLLGNSSISGTYDSLIYHGENLWNADNQQERLESQKESSEAIRQTLQSAMKIWSDLMGDHEGTRLSFRKKKILAK